MAATKKSSTKKSSATKAKSSTKTKAASAKSASRSKASGSKASGSKSRAKGAARTDKSLEAFRDTLERSLTIPRDRVQEVVNDAVRRGRITRKDADELVNKLVARGTKARDEFLRDIEKLLKQARKDIEKRTRKASKEVRGRAKKAQRDVERRTKKAQKRVESARGEATKTLIEAADKPLARADTARRAAGVGPTFPVTAYDSLNVAQVKSRLKDLNKADLRKVRTHENKSKARKGILNDIEKRLAS